MLWMGPQWMVKVRKNFISLTCYMAMHKFASVYMETPLCWRPRPFIFLFLYFIILYFILFYFILFYLFIFEAESPSVTQAGGSDRISAHCNLHLLGSSNPLASASWVAEITGMHHHTRLSSVFLAETEFHHVGQASLELLISWSAFLGFPKYWDYRCEPQCPERESFIHLKGH